MLDQALQYAGRGWPVFPVSGFKVPFKGTHGHLDATTDPALIRSWWQHRPQANIALATGTIVVLDADGPGGVAKLKALRAIGEQHGETFPRTLTAQTSRGYHLFFQASPGHHIRTRNDKRQAKGSDGLDIKAHGGFVVLPPSVNRKTGYVYKWILELPIATLPLWLANYLQTQQKEAPAAPPVAGVMPAFLEQRQSDRAGLSTELEQAIRTPWSVGEEERIVSALAAIPADCDRDTWLQVGMALHGLGWAGNDSDRGYELWHAWSATGKTKYQGAHDLETRWRSFGKGGREQVTLGTLYHHAQQHGWQGSAPKEAPSPFKEVMSNTGTPSRLTPATTPPHSAYDTQGGAQLNGFHLPAHITASSNPDSPLIDLNHKYAVVGDVGGKCLVLGWVPSKIDSNLQVPSFQTFKSFADRYAHRYVNIKVRKEEGWEEKTVQMGSHWLKWPQRTNYEGIDMVPNAPAILANNVLNLWKGFAIAPAAGPWPRMRRHIAEILANGDMESLTYIIKWAAWKLQHPGERAEVALVFKGDKGSGKGTFANALKRIFGPHGMQIFSAKHMTGQFNAHLRSCLLLYADEAFWAGDKQGESVLKGMLTEPTLVIEQKGIDPTSWTNRLGIIMAANADWVVPAGQKERRYAVFNVNGKKAGDYKYFEDLYAELENGGLAAMLHDLLAFDLGNWHPRLVPQTQALQEQKLRSFDTRFEWFENMLSEGVLHGSLPDQPAISAQALYQDFVDNSPGNRHCSKTAFGLFLREQGCIKIHGAQGNRWRFLPLKEHRDKWTARFGQWQWAYDGADWLTKTTTV